VHGRRAAPCRLVIGVETASVRRGHSRKRLAALDDLEQGGLLTEQVGGGAEHDADADTAGPPGAGDLVDRGADDPAFVLEGVLQGDNHLVGVDGEGGDEGTFEHLERVPSQQLAILEGAWLAFRPVDDDGCRGERRVGGGDGPPLHSSRKAGTHRGLAAHWL
jgi:hypothetical protein